MKELIELYTTRIKNLEWHIEINGKYMTEQELLIKKQRISDFKDFIYHLGG